MPAIMQQIDPLSPIEKWIVPSFDEDKKLDEEILGIFNLESAAL